MHHRTPTDWVKLSLAFNTVLRAELAAIKHELAARNSLEAKHNPHWREQPRAPQGSPDGGQWVGARRHSRLRSVAIASIRS